MIDHQKKDIPPGLLRIVKGNKLSKKFYFLVGVSLFLMIAGSGVTYLYIKYFPLKMQNKPHSIQKVTQNMPQAQQTEKETNKTESSKNALIHETKTLQQPNSSKENQKKENLKVTKKTKKDNNLKELSLESLETFKGADFLYRAQDFEEKGLINEAINEYKEYVNYSGKAEPKILNKIATLYLLSGNLKEADHYAELAINSSKHEKEILINYGVIKAKMGELNKAEEIFNKVLSLDSQNKTAIYNLAIVKEKRGKYKEALNLYERLYQLGDSSVIFFIERLKEGS